MYGRCPGATSPAASCPKYQPFEFDATTVWLDLPKNRVEQRRLAAAIGPDYAEDLAGLHIEADAADGLNGTVTLLMS